MKIPLISWLYPHIIETVKSPINGRIQVVEILGSRYISIGGLSQSGGLVKNLWESGLKKLRKEQFEPRTCLVLGVGGGTVIQLIVKYFPQADITGVELDPNMIKLGKKYFGLKNSKNLNIIIADALIWVNDTTITKHFDLILVDLYIGKEVPKQLNRNEFLLKLRSLLTKKGIIIFNRLRNRDNKIEINTFINLLKSISGDLTVEKPLINYLIYWR